MNCTTKLLAISLAQFQSRRMQKKIKASLFPARIRSQLAGALSIIYIYLEQRLTGERFKAQAPLLISKKRCSGENGHIF